MAPPAVNAQPRRLECEPRNATNWRDGGKSHETQPEHDPGPDRWIPDDGREPAQRTGDGKESTRVDERNPERSVQADVEGHLSHTLSRRAAVLCELSKEDVARRRKPHR